MLYEGHLSTIYRDIGSSGWLCSVSTILALQTLKIEPGLYNRKPVEWFEDQAHDDYTGVCSISPASALEVVIRGKEHGWVYDSRDPSTNFTKYIKNIVFKLRPWNQLRNLWHKRIPGQTTHYKIAAGMSINLFAALVWLGSIYFTTRKKGNESGWLLDYLKMRTAIGMSPNKWYSKLAKRIFEKALSKHYGGNIRNVYAIYFGPSHPFSLYSDWGPISLS